MTEEDKSIKIEFSLTQQDFVNAMLFHYSTHKKGPIFILLAFVIGYILYITKAFTNNLQLNDIIFIALFLIVYLLVTIFSYKYHAKKQYATSSVLKSSYVLIIKDTELLYSYELGESKIKWEAIVKTINNNHFYLLYTSNSNFLIIPKKVMNKKEIKIFDNYIKP